MFRYDDAIIEQYPDVVVGVIYAEGMTNGQTPDPLLALYQAEQEAVRARIGNTPLSEIESLAAWRRVFSSFGVKPTQYRSAAESLLRRLTKKGDIPSINLLVDAGNLVSIRYGLPVAVMDVRGIDGEITVHFADGAETFTNLNGDEVQYPDPGEVVFTDESDNVVARRWCWRQSDASAAREDTTAALITIEAHHSREAVEQAVQDMLDLLKAYAGGTAIYDVLDAQHTRVKFHK
jgi:DNA/RNA-binding domain of Phe-tRNA-synthetase-like protein